MALVAPEQVDRMIARLRVHMQAATFVQAALLALVVLSGLVNPVGVRIGKADLGTVILVIAAVLWVVLMSRSTRHGHLIHYGVALAGQGLGAQAAPFLAEAIERFSIFRLSKLLAAQHLAEVAHSQRDFATATRLAAEVLRYDLARRKGLDRVAALVLADSLLELGDLVGTADVLALLHGQRLSLTERLQMLPVLLRWQMATGHFAQAIDQLKEKVRLAELLDSEHAGLVNLLLAAAARHQDLHGASRFLLDRARLYCDLERLAERKESVRPFVAELHAAGA